MVDKKFKHKIRYTAIVGEMSNGDIIEADGIIEGLTTAILEDGKVMMGCVVRHIHEE